MESDNKSLDLLGIKPIADAVKIVTEATVKGASSFLGKICMPAAEEVGLLLKDHVSEWRKSNASKVILKAEKLVDERGNGKLLIAPPRLAYRAVEQGSWEESDEMQSIWAGLLASSCTEDGIDESNLLFMNIVAQLTSSQARLLSAACDKAKVFVDAAGWIYAGHTEMDLAEVRAVTGVDDEHRLDRELDHLRGLELIEGGFRQHTLVANVTPLPLCLQLCARITGYVGSPVEFFDAKPAGPEDDTF